jgi:triosephosphate isomerase
MPKLIIANWKMNPETMREAKEIFQAIKKSATRIGQPVVICPPFLFIEPLSKLATPKINLGAEDLSRVLPTGGVGAYTGETSGLQIRGAGAKYAISGHSERRLLGDTDEVVNKKVKAALKSGLKPILCVGESKRDDAGNFLHFIRKQLELDLADVSKSDLDNLIIAYEPIWAIGKLAKREASPEECREIVIFIKKVLADMFGRKPMEKVKIIYGGSVNERNARDYITTGAADGLLIGRVSLKPQKFNEILKAIKER